MNDNKLTKIPTHIAFILDGNRRWARSKGLPDNEGHKKGFEKIEELCNWCLKYGVKYLTLYCLSIENLNRSKIELDYLFKYLKDALSENNINKMNNKQIKLQILGDFDLLPADLTEKIREVNEKQKMIKDNNTTIHLQLCIGYGARREIADAVKSIVNKVKNNELKLEEINEDIIAENLYTTGMPDPDLLVRTGGEQRLSNFLLWQCSYTELYFCEKMLPEFEEKDFLLALYFFENRNRRYGR